MLLRFGLLTVAEPVERAVAACPSEGYGLGCSGSSEPWWRAWRSTRPGRCVISVGPEARERARCGVCRRRCPGFDLGEGRRRWRTLDVGTTLCFLEACAPRVTCRRHGVVVCAVPWARHNSRFTRRFEDQPAWLAVNCSKTAVAALMRVAWRTVGGICARVAAEAQADRDLLAGLRRIGVDEISHRKGHRYLTVVVDHDTGRLVWAAPGQDRKTIERFLNELGPLRAARTGLLRHGQLDHPPGRRALPDCRGLPGPVPRRQARHRRPRRRPSRGVKRRPPPRPAAARQGAQGRAVRALKEPREPHRPSTSQAVRRPAHQPQAVSRLPAQRTTPPDIPTAGHRRDRAAGPLAGLGTPLPPPRIRQARQDHHRATRRDPRRHHTRPVKRPRRSVNTQIRLITRRAFGFHSPQALIALAMLSLADLCPPLPGR